MEQRESIENKEQEKKEEESKEVDELDNLISYESKGMNLSSIEGIEYLDENFEKVQKIKLPDNKLEDISEFFKFSNLIYLDLSHNKIQKLENLSPLINLEILIISNNNLKSIGFNLVSLKKLQHLDLGFNLLEVNDGSLIKSLKFNPELISLVLSGNVNYNFEACKYICLEYLDKIEFLDTIQIVETKKKNVSMKSVSVTVKGKGGKVQKVKRLKDYIKFKLEDIKENEKEYEELKNYKPKQTIDAEPTSYYYYHLLNMLK